MHRVNKLFLYWHTLRHLRPVQIYGRILFRLRRPAPDLRPAPGLRTTAGDWVAPARRAPSLLDPRRFSFLNTDGDLSTVGWDGSERDKLWRYNQHYFDDLNALDGDDRAAWHKNLLAEWVQSNPPTVGSGWEPYPTSLRIVNWTKWALAGHSLPDECVQSLAVQARWLTQKLEWHLLGNHLFSNAKALIFAGLFFSGEEAEDWLQTGLHILHREIPEQILADGGQFERSPMYHALAFEDMLDLVNLLTCFSEDLDDNAKGLLHQSRTILHKMQRWLNVMSHPDKKISFFNDAAFGVAPENSELNAYAERCGVVDQRSLSSIEWMEESGYMRLETTDAAVILDAGPVGPDYLPGHAHADTLSFEFSIFGKRVFTNSGTSLYGLSGERERQRGTAAHNTVLVDQQNSSEVWSGFRVARRACPLNPRIDDTGKQLSAECSHDGYARLPGRPHHKRSWTLTPTRLLVTDYVSNPLLTSEARFHLHPDMQISMDDSKDRGILKMADGKCLAWRATGQPCRVEETTWHPRFGTSIANSCLVLPLKNGRSNFLLEWD